MEHLVRRTEANERAVKARVEKVLADKEGAPSESDVRSGLGSYFWSDSLGVCWDGREQGTLMIRCEGGSLLALPLQSSLTLIATAFATSSSRLAVISATVRLERRLCTPSNGLYVDPLDLSSATAASSPVVEPFRSSLAGTLSCLPNHRRLPQPAWYAHSDQPFPRRHDSSFSYPARSRRRVRSKHRKPRQFERWQRLREPRHWRQVQHGR